MAAPRHDSCRCLSRLQQPKPRCGSLSPVIQRRKPTWITASCRKIGTAPEGGVPGLCHLSPLSEELSPDPKPPLQTQALLRSTPGVGRGRGSAPRRKQKDATADRGERRRRGTRSLFTARAESALRAPNAHIEQGGLSAEGWIRR